MVYTENAYAKINLYLNVLGIRPDGYHEIESIMQQISLCDRITLTKNPGGDKNRITITCTDPAVPTDQGNIVHKCAVAFFNAFEIQSYDIAIHIEKHVPSSAGMAGGSSDGATVLKLLNEAFAIGASLERLCQIGAKVGADIPFCILGKTCLCRGIGDKLTPLSLPTPSYSLLIAFPGEGVSTPVAYRLLDETPADEANASVEEILSPLRQGKRPEKLYNAFERAILPVHEGASYLHRRLQELGADSVLMSGSGPTVFGLYEDEKALTDAKDTLQKEGYAVFEARPVC